MKGKEWYQVSEIADAYEDKRFTGGGRLIDERERDAVLSALSPLEGKRILEIACGTGRFSVMLGARGAEVVGLDISLPMLSQGREKMDAAQASPNVEFVRGDAGRLPFPDDHFDAVFAVRFFHLAPTPRRFLEEMRRVSRDIIFFDTFNAFSSRRIYNWLLPMGSRLYSERDVHNLLAAADLELVSAEHDFVIPYGCYRSIPDWIAKPLRWFDERAGGNAVGERTASVSFWIATEGSTVPR